MELKVSFQALQFGCCALLGGSLGLFYDLLRVLRRQWHGLTLPLDLLFVLVSAVSFLLFALYAGQGQFRFFFFPGILLGTCLYFLTLSPPLCRGLGWVLRLFCRAARLLGRGLRRLWKFFMGFLKKTVANVRKSAKIKNRVKSGGVSRRKRGVSE